MVGKGKGKAAAAPVASKPMSVVDARRAQLLVKPRKRSRREALPSVLHLVRSVHLVVSRVCVCVCLRCLLRAG